MLMPLAAIEMRIVFIHSLRPGPYHSLRSSSTLVIESLALIDILTVSVMIM